MTEKLLLGSIDYQYWTRKIFCTKSNECGVFIFYIYPVNAKY